MSTCSILSIHPVLIAAVAASSVLSASAAAQDAYLYAFNSEGRVVVNAYALDTLQHGKDGNNEDETWRDLYVQGPDRWLLRGDGRIALNGDLLDDDLEGDEGWRSIVVDDGGDFTALRNDGLVAGPAGTLANLPQGDFSFPDMVTNGTSVFVLKTNGAVFRIPETEPLIVFDGPPGEISGNEDDGEAPDTSWMRLGISPDDGRIWALRGDGTLKSENIPLLPPLTPDVGVLEAALPYDQSDNSISENQLYADFAFDEAGDFLALRSDGKVYSTASPTVVVVDYPGDPDDDEDEDYVSLIAAGTIPVALRADGKIFRDTLTEEVVDLKDENYRRLVLGTELPDLTNVKNAAPFISSATITAPEGTDIILLVIVADRDLPAEDLVVELVPDTLPAGASFDPVTRILNWPAAGPPGTYKVKMTVSDGIANPVKATQTITIKPLDTNESKNIKPTMSKVKGAVALVGAPFALPLSTFDLDGNPVSLQLNPNVDPPPPGASFDGGNNVLSWIVPLLEQTGTTEFKFLVSDGIAEVKQSVKVKVQTSLLTL